MSSPAAPTHTQYIRSSRRSSSFTHPQPLSPVGEVEISWKTHIRYANAKCTVLRAAHAPSLLHRTVEIPKKILLGTTSMYYMDRNSRLCFVEVSRFQRSSSRACIQRVLCQILSIRRRFDFCVAEMLWNCMKNSALTATLRHCDTVTSCMQPDRPTQPPTAHPPTQSVSQSVTHSLTQSLTLAVTLSQSVSQRRSVSQSVSQSVSDLFKR